MSGTIKMNPNSKVYCTYVNNSIHYDVTGRVAPCCQFRGTDEPTYVTPTEYFNSDWLAKLKQQMNNNEYIEGCKRCYIDEQISGRSLRTDGNSKNIKKLHFAYSNICNKSCNICRPQRSHLVGSDYKKVLDNNPNDYFMQEKFARQKFTKKIIESGKLKLESIVDWISTDEIRKHLHKFNQIEFNGGEPFMHPELHSILDMLKEENYQGRLSFTTNGSVSKDYLDKIEKFNNVFLEISIDGVKNLYKVVRPPHDYNWFLDKMQLINQYKSIKKIWHYVIHVFNVHQIPDIIEESKKLNIDCDYGALGQQEYLHASLVPNEVIAETIKRIENIDSLKFKNVINYLQGCMTRTNTPEQIKLFHAYVNSFGTVKNINYQQYIPWNFASIK